MIHKNINLIIFIFILQTSSTSSDEPIYVVEALLYCSKAVKKLAGGEAPIPCKEGEKGEMQVKSMLKIKNISR